MKRFPCETPNAPIRSVRAKSGTPPAASKKRTRPSKVCSRSIEGGEPPQPPPTPAQDRPEAPHLPQPPTLRPLRAVRPVELSFLARGGLDRHAHRRRRPKPRAPQITEIAHHARVGTRESFHRDDLEHARGQQLLRRRGDQLADPLRPTFVDHPFRRGDRPRRRRASVLQPFRDRRRVIPQLVRDLTDRVSLTAQSQQVHVLLLGHHAGWSLQFLSVLGRPKDWRGRQPGRWMVIKRSVRQTPSTATFADPRTRDSMSSQQRPCPCTLVASPRAPRTNVSPSGSRSPPAPVDALNYGYKFSSIITNTRSRREDCSSFRKTSNVARA